MTSLMAPSPVETHRRLGLHHRNFEGRQFSPRPWTWKGYRVRGGKTPSGQRASEGRKEQHHAGWGRPRWGDLKPGGDASRAVCEPGVSPASQAEWTVTHAQCLDDARPFCSGSHWMSLPGCLLGPDSSATAIKKHSSWRGCFCWESLTFSKNEFGLVPRSCIWSCDLWLRRSEQWVNLGPSLTPGERCRRRCRPRPTVRPFVAPAPGGGSAACPRISAEGAALGASREQSPGKCLPL